MESAALLQKEAKIEHIEDGNQNKQNDLLQRKWLSVVRLQKKIMKLEKELETFRSTNKTNNQQVSDGLPIAPCKVTLKGHRDNVNSVKFHPEYDTVLCSASEDATIRTWDTESGTVEKVLKGHTQAVRDIDFHSKGKLLVSCSSDLTLKLWDFESKTCIKTLHGHNHTISTVKFLPSGEHIVSGSRDSTIKLWETESGFCTGTFEGHSGWVRSIAVNEDGTYIASASSDQTVKVWDIKSFKEIITFRLHTNVVECVSFSPKSANKILSRKLRKEEEIDDSLILQEPPGKYIASGGRDKIIYIFDTITGELILKFAGHDNWIRGLLFHPDGKHLISVSDDKTIRVWSLLEERCIKVLEEAHTHFIQCLDFCKQNPQIATGSVDGVVSIWSCR